MDKITKMVATAVLLLVLPLGAQAAHITVLSALINGDQAAAGAGTGSDGIGSATVTYNSNTGEMEWFVAWQNITATVTNAHFHGPAAPGSNAGVQVAIDFASNPSIGMATITANQAADLLAGLWYVNIHTDLFPSGEIRGQVVPLVAAIPVPAAAWLMLSALAAAGIARRRNVA